MAIEVLAILVVFVALMSFGIGDIGVIAALVEIEVTHLGCHQHWRQVAGWVGTGSWMDLLPPLQLVFFMCTCVCL